MNIVVVGVGYVGLITGLGLSHLNHKVQFVDIDSEKIKKLNNKLPPFYEPKLDEYLNDEVVGRNVTFSDNYDEIFWDNVDIIMVCVQTPSLDTHKVDTSFLNKVFEAIQHRSTRDTVICIKSTIHPDALKDVIKSSKLSEESLVFNPEFLREGTAFSDFFNPDRIVIGSKNELNARKVYELYSKIDSEVIFTNPVSSQLIKYLSNAYLPLRLSFVNEATQIIKELGGDLTQTLQGIGMDKRIGLDYFRPSPGWGGSCFPKDVSEVVSISKSKKLEIPLISSILESNNQHKSWFAKYLEKLKDEKKYKNIVLIGLAFKENTDDLRHSPTIDLYNKLNNGNVFVYDEYFKNHESIKFISKLPNESLIVEMYPLDKDFQTKINKEIGNLTEYEYIKFWE